MGFLIPWLGSRQAHRRAFIQERIGPIERFTNTTGEYFELLEGHAQGDGVLGVGHSETAKALASEMSHALLPDFLPSHSALEAIDDAKLTETFTAVEKMGGVVRMLVDLGGAAMPAHILSSTLVDGEKTIRRARRRIKALLV